MFVTMLGLVSVGCAKPIIARAYDGPELSKKEIATLKLYSNVRFKSINGQKLDVIPEDFVDDEGQPDGEVRERHIQVKPGTHRMVVGRAPAWTKSQQPLLIYHLHQFHPGWPHNVEIEFTAAAGKSYMLVAEDGKDHEVHVTTMGFGKGIERLIGRVPEPSYARLKKLQGTRWGPG
ncbi:MAG TPA: hypothetical protein VGR35_16095 [Tepidisphaeraceae bacterium]|nr:hypothetical protein [Tepidisphaeraceae bacterium]